MPSRKNDSSQPRKAELPTAVRSALAEVDPAHSPAPQETATSATHPAPEKKDKEGGRDGKDTVAIEVRAASLAECHSCLVKLC